MPGWVFKVRSVSWYPVVGARLYETHKKHQNLTRCVLMLSGSKSVLLSKEAGDESQSHQVLGRYLICWAPPGPAVFICLGIVVQGVSKWLLIW